MMQIENSIFDFTYTGKLSADVSLKKYNSWRVGGVAEFVYKPDSLQALINFLQNLYKKSKDIKITWLGLGSNILIRDNGLKGLVILAGFTSKSSKSSKSNKFENLENSENNNIINSYNLNGIKIKDHNTAVIGASVTCAKLAKFYADNNNATGAFWAGIPGTVGGALAMNAGCYGYETWEFVDSVSIITRDGRIFDLDSNDFDVKYRKSNLKQEIKADLINNLDYWFVSANLKLDMHLDKLRDSIYLEQPRQAIKDLLQKRADAQPIGKFSGGSVFKNPKGTHAAKLIDDAGLKGYRIGGAYISEKHANFIINDKTAKAKDIEDLICYIQGKILDIYNIKLEPEVKILGG